jgi:hypothetical protein
MLLPELIIPVSIEILETNFKSFLRNYVGINKQ